MGLQEEITKNIKLVKKNEKLKERIKEEKKKILELSDRIRDQEHELKNVFRFF